MSEPVRFDDAALEHLLESLDGPVGKDMHRRGLNVANRQRRLLSQHGTGNIYTTRFFTASNGKVIPYGTRPAHQASAPGEPPAVDTGRLRATIGTHAHVDEHGIRVDIGSGADPAIPGVKYAKYLENGTRKMAARPFLRPSLDAVDDHTA